MLRLSCFGLVAMLLISCARRVPPTSDVGPPNATFPIVVSGSADPEMISLTLENTGRSSLRGLYVGRQGWPDFRSARALVNSILQSIDAPLGKPTDKEKAMAIWRFATQYGVHWYPPEPDDELHDVIKLFAVYG